MSEIPYTPYYGKIKEYFDKFQQVGNPTKVNRPWLELLGFKSGNDAYIVSVLKFIGLIDSSNVPTDRWKIYKDPTKAPAVLAEAIRYGYKELFATYPDANRKDREALYAFFSSKTGKAKATVDYMVNTFINLCQLADFGAEVSEPVKKATEAETKEPIVAISPKLVKGVISEMHINIQLHLPPH